MSSSTFEVTETEKDSSFNLEASEESIELSAQVDGEIQKDHTYTKDPDDSEEESEKPDEEKCEKNEAVEKNHNSKNLKSPKKNNPRNAKNKKEATSKKEVLSPKKNKTKKDVLTEESNKEESTKSEKSDDKNEMEKQPKTSKKGRKRKIEEKENVIDNSIVQDIQNINEADPSPNVDAENPTKKKKADDEKVTKTKKSEKVKKAPTVKDENSQKLPKGWVRKEVVRKSGKTAGQVDVYIYSPDGIKFRSRPDIAAYLARTKSNLKIEDFNFSKKKTGESTPAKVPVKATPKKEKSPPAKSKSPSPKKKSQSLSTPTKKGAKLLVKLSFTPKGKKGKNVKKVLVKESKKENKSSGKKSKVSGSTSKVSKKKKTT